MSRKSNKISVYVPCFNAEDTIMACLASLLAQRRKPDQILVIDDGSTDRTVEIARRFGVDVVSHAANRGLSQTRNSGVREATGDLVGSIDADVLADPLWLLKLERAIDSDPDIVGVGGALFEKEKKTAADRWRDRHMSQNLGLRTVENPKLLFGANTLFRKAAVLEAGGYPERRMNHGEDHQICQRIYRRLKDKKLLYVGRALCFHLRRDGFRSLILNFWRYQTVIAWDANPGMPLSGFCKLCWDLARFLWRKALADLKAGEIRLSLISLLAIPYVLYLQVGRLRQDRRENRA